MRHVSFDIVLVVALAVASAAFAAGRDREVQIAVNEPASVNTVGLEGDVRLADAISYAIAFSPVLRVAQTEVEVSTGAVTRAGISLKACLRCGQEAFPFRFLPQSILLHSRALPYSMASS